MTNIITLEGNLTRDAEHKKTKNGTELLQFSIAHNRPKR